MVFVNFFNVKISLAVKDGIQGAEDTQYKRVHETKGRCLDTVQESCTGEAPLDVLVLLAWAIDVSKWKFAITFS